MNLMDSLFQYRFTKLSLVSLLCLCFILVTSVFAGNSVRIVKMEPSGEVGPKTNFVFVFSADVAPKSRIGKLTTTKKIRFRPAVPGKIRWETPRRLKFLPEVTLQPSTAYTVEFYPDFLIDLRKNLTGNRKLSFSTERFKVIDSNLDFVYNSQAKRGIIFQARLNFNYPVDLENLQRDLKIYFVDKKQPIKFSVVLNNGGREAFINSQLLLRGPTARKVELNLPQGFLCKGATIGLKDRFLKTADFRAEQALEINDINTLSEDGRNIINIRCSEPVDPDSVENFITLKPKVKFRITTTGETITLSSDDLKPGNTYEVQVAKGLPSLNGKPLQKNISDDCTFPDLEPSVSFNSPGRYLSNKGNLNIGLETVNIPQVDVEIAKIYANNILAYLGSLNEDGYCYSSYLDRFGRVVQTQKINVANDANEVITTPINLREFLSDNRRGIFQITACDPENRWRNSAKIAIITDLGILAKMGENDLVVWVNSLENLAPKSGVKVSLLSYNNQVIVTGETNNQGMVTFNDLRQQLADFRSYVIMAEQGDDVSFICFKDSLIDKTDFNIEGRPQLTDGYEAFLYTDRGVFRPGEKANLAAIVRGANNSIPPEFPVRLEVIGPDGMVFREYAGNTRSDGVIPFKVDIPDYARTGKYTALLYIAKQAVGNTTFNVEDFMPDRIKVEATTDKGQYSKGDSAKLEVSGINLFGPPAAGRRVDLAVRLEPVPFSTPDYRSYKFGDPDREARVVEDYLGVDELDAKGKAKFAYDFPNNLSPSGYIRTIFQATVTEDGGRAVSNYKTVDYFPYNAYIGIKPDGDYYAKVGENYSIRLVEVKPTGEPVYYASLTAEIYSVTWNSIYRRDRQGRYTYHSERQENRISKDSITLNNGEGLYTYRPNDYGCFKIVFTDLKTGAQSTYEFYATGWGYAPWAMDHPDRIQIDLDKQLYKTGETAKVQIKAPFSGRALVTVEREKVYDTKVIELKENTGVISIPIKSEYKPNVYVSVHLIRATKQLDKRAPTRAFGAVSLNLDNSDNRVDLTINSAEEIRPNQTTEVQVSAAGLTGNTFLTLAVVDEGICQLTEFQTPDPMSFFYGKRSLSLDTYDLYGMLLPEVESVNTTNSPGGDESMEKLRRRNLNPVSVRRVKPVSLWSGLVKLDNEGKAVVKLDIPQFNGTIRLMAVAISGANYGSATKKMLVREPIVITSTYPRFIAPGDRVVIPVSVFNGTGQNGDFEVKLNATGPVTIDGYDFKKVTLNNQQEKTVNFAVVAKKEVGKCRFTLTSIGNDYKSNEITDVGIRPAGQITSKVLAGSVTAQKQLALDLKNAWIPGTGEYTLSLGSLPTLKFSGGLKYLLGYPYGCIEQTTSKLFPMLYFDELARVAQPDLFTDGKADRYLIEGIQKIESMQLRDGSFSFWPNSDWSSDWGSVYATNFLIEARLAGHTVSDRVYEKMLSHLWRLSKKRSDYDWSLQLRTYALYVLSLAKKAQLSSMAYIKNQRLNDLYPDARTLLAAAYYYAGDRKTARELLPTTFSTSDFTREKGRNFNSSIRTAAICLGLLADVDPKNPAIPKLMARLAENVKAERWGTTQENAFAFMAMGKVLKNSQNADYSGEILVNGRSIGSFDSKTMKKFNDPRLGEGIITVKIKGSGECFYYAESNGIAAVPEPDTDSGMTVRREYFDRFGQKVDLKGLKQGDLLVAKITVKTTEANTDNVAIVDMLPAGLEIENPRLASSAKINWLDKNIFSPDYMDIRDDRLMLFSNFEDSGDHTFYYALRVVSRGTFALPQIKAECMYAPEVYSLSSGGTVIVDK